MTNGCVARPLCLELALEQVGDHLPAGDDNGAPESGEVEGAAKSVGKAEEEHGRDPAASVLEGKAALRHLVLLDLTPREPVHAARRVDLSLVLARSVDDLGARQDVEVVIGCVATSVALGADRSAEDDEVLGDAWYQVSNELWREIEGQSHTGMNDVHSTHCTTGIVENPLLIGVDVRLQLVLAGQLINDVLDDGAGVVAMGGNAALGEVMEMVQVEDVEAVQVLLQIVNNWREHAEQDGENLEPAGNTTSAALGLLAVAATAGRLLRLGRSHWGRGTVRPGPGTWDLKRTQRGCGVGEKRRGMREWGG